jgi:hypothetical protein
MNETEAKTESGRVLREYALMRAKMIENYIALYIKKTGANIDEIVLVEKRSSDGLRVEWYCMPKKDERNETLP